jgi:hypothetical protein
MVSTVSLNRFLLLLEMDLSPVLGGCTTAGGLEGGIGFELDVTTLLVSTTAVFDCDLLAVAGTGANSWVSDNLSGAKSSHNPFCMWCIRAHFLNSANLLRPVLMTLSQSLRYSVLPLDLHRTVKFSGTR